MKKMPIEEMSFEKDKGICVRGLPLYEQSTASQIKIGLGVVGFKMPQLKMIIIRDGGNLDRKSIRQIKDYAEKNNLMVLIERVDPMGGIADKSYYIEEGVATERSKPFGEGTNNE